MKKETFNYIWNNWFKVGKDKLLEKSSQLRFYDKVDEIYKFYSDENRKTHKFMQDTKGPIDRHKIAAIIAFSIIEKQPFRAIKPQLLIDYLPNEYFALDCSLVVTQKFAIKDANENNDETKKNAFLKGFCFPESTDGCFDEYIAKLFYHYKNKSTFSILSFANVLYFLENYTLLKYKYDILKKNKNTE